MIVFLASTTRESLLLIFRWLQLLVVVKMPLTLRFYRDSRCGSVMIPWTAETCLERIGRESLYEAGETDD